MKTATALQTIEVFLTLLFCLKIPFFRASGASISKTNVVCSYSGFPQLCCTVCHFLSYRSLSGLVSLSEYVQNLIWFLSVTSKGTFFCRRATVVLIHIITSAEPRKTIKAFYDSLIWCKLCFFGCVWEWDSDWLRFEQPTCLVKPVNQTELQFCYT